MRCLYREQRYDFGNYSTVSLYPVFCKGRRRCRKYKATSDVQQVLNDANAKERTARQLAANYTRRGLYLTLTYDACLPDSREAVIRDFQNFIRRLGRAYDRGGLELKYHAWIHGDVSMMASKRFHIHCVISEDIGLDRITKLWGKGIVEGSRLRFAKNGLQGLARYVINGMTWGRCMHSRNIVDPVPRSRTGKVTQAQADMIGQYWNDAKAYEGIYPGYKIATVKPFYNAFNRFYYLRIYLYKDKEGFDDGPEVPLLS